MIILPAIDIRNKKAVRLTQGDYDRMTVYSNEPREIAQKFKAAGVKEMHVVDLDGALDGALVNFDVISDIVKNCKLDVEVGGGIRDEERIRRYLDIGVKRVILGTVAVENFGFVEKACNKFESKIAVGVDAKNGKVAVRGWKTITDLDAFEFCKRLYDAGVETVIYTDISKDGLLCGANLEAYEKLAEIKGLKVIASGGISSVEEIKKLKGIGIYGAILGKALYEGKMDLIKALGTAEAKC